MTDQYDSYEWKMRRKEILVRDNYTCQNPECGSRTSTMHVHHIRYNGKVWESPDEDLTTLCNTCHETIEKRKFQEREAEAFKIMTPAQFQSAKEWFDFLKKGITLKDLRREIAHYIATEGETPFIKYAKYVLNI